MVTNTPTVDITAEEAELLISLEEDLIAYGKTDVKCPRCDGNIIVSDFGSSYTIGCENDCVKVGFRGI